MLNFSNPTDSFSFLNLARIPYYQSGYSGEDNKMALRVIEMVLPEDIGKYAYEYLRDQQEHSLMGLWYHNLAEGEILVKMLVSVGEAEAVLDLIANNYGSVDGFRAVLIPVAASLPRQEPVAEKQDDEEIAESEADKERKRERISREELYVNIGDAARLSNAYIAMVILSAIVATMGVLHDNVAVVIGAMVIAPLLGPNAALSLATTLGDGDLARTALKAGGAGIALSVLLSVVIGLLLQVDPTIHEIASRTQVGLSDIAIALAAGGAGTLAFTSGVPAVLVGVMVAVALLPPLVTSGLLIGSGFFHLAWGALLLFITNLICINLSGVIFFVFQGIRPRIWWEADRAKKATRNAILIWIVLLCALILVILFSQKS